jgi:hypothetical protein
VVLDFFLSMLYLKMNRFEEAKIYTIRNIENPYDVYVGSTIQKYLCQRFAKHLQDCRKGKNCLLYQRMRDTRLTNWYIELYEAYPCKNREELLRREGEVIKEIGTLNKNIAGRSVAQWYKDNKKIVVDRMKIYYKANRDARLAYQNDYNKHKRCNHNAYASEGGLEVTGLIS